jgi:hypothetical protein
MPCENSGNTTSTNEALNFHTLWSILDCALMVIILCGNTLTILAIRCSRRLSNVMSNHFVLSLAVSDLVVGLTLPYHMAFYLSDEIGKDKETCILRFVLLALGCTASVCNLIIIAIDRYISIVHPLHYCRLLTNRYVRWHYCRTVYCKHNIFCFLLDSAIVTTE